MEIDHCVFPDDLLYSAADNVWVRLEGSNLAVLGVTSIMMWFSGKVNSVKYRSLQDVFERGRSLATIEGVRAVQPVRTPLTCELVEVNRELHSSPKTVNDEPYAGGWLVKIRPLDLVEEQMLLEPIARAAEKFRRQVQELRVKCFKAYPDHVMFEIGVECAAVLVRLNELMGRIRFGEVVHVVSDDPTADIEMQRWSAQTGQRVLESRQEDSLMHFIVVKVK